MSDKDEKRNGPGNIPSDFFFTELIISFQAAAWQHLGKVPSMVSGKVERNLELAKHTIDMLGMLETKTKGNLSDDEKKIIEHILFELRLNYLDELKKGDTAKEEKQEKESPQAEEQTEKPQDEQKSSQ